MFGSCDMLIVGAELDLNIIRSPVRYPSFGSLLLAEDRGDLEIGTEQAEQTVIYRIYEKGEQICIVRDSFDTENGIFIRKFKTSRPISFMIQTPDYVRFLHRKPIRTMKMNHPCFCCFLPAGLAVNGYEALTHDSFLSAAFVGDIGYDWESESVTFQRGRGCMILCTHSDPNTLAKRMSGEVSRIEKLLDEEIKTVKRESRTFNANLHLLSRLTTHKGLILSDPNMPKIDPMTQYLCTRAFIAIGENRRARHILRAYTDSFSKTNRITWSESGGCKAQPAPCEDSVTPALVILAAQTLPKTKFSESITPMLCTLIKRQRAQLVRAMMPFNGNENCPEAKYLTYHGSALATVLFTESAKALCEMLGDDESELTCRLKEDIAECESRFAGNFIAQGTPLLNSPARETSSRRPRFKFGYCEYCSPRSAEPEATWLDRTHYGIYLCPECSVKGVPEKHAIDPNSRRVSYHIVLWAALMNSPLYPRGLVRQIAMSLISCPENEIVCRTDAALLKYTARKFELEEKYITAAEKLEERFDNEITAASIALDILFDTVPKKRRKRQAKR